MEKNVYLRAVSMNGDEKIFKWDNWETIRDLESYPGTILLLSNNENSSSLLQWLSRKGTVLFYSGRLNAAMLEKIQPNLVISYNYRHIISPEAIKVVSGKIINMHISLLPWNRGASPNLWSIIDNTPKGVTIHVLDDGLDTGDILLQKELTFDEDKETLRSSYELLNYEIVKLLQDNWEYIWRGEWNPRKQLSGGSKHTVKDLQEFLHGRNFSYDMTISDFKRDFGIR